MYKNREKLIELLAETCRSKRHCSEKVCIESRAQCQADWVSHLLANGVIILPYKIGDTVWEINSENPFEDELKVMETKVEDLFVGTSLDLHHIDSNFLFTNKEDAEKALNKIKGEFDESIGNKEQ